MHGLQVTLLLKELAKTGKMTVVAVMHQPRYEMFQEFDNLILLEKGGRIAFQGTRDSAKVKVHWRTSLWDTIIWLYTEHM